MVIVARPLVHTAVVWCGGGVLTRPAAACAHQGSNPDRFTWDMKGEFWAFTEQRPGTARYAVGVSAERMDKLKKAWNEVSAVY